MRIKVTSDGTPLGTKVLNADTGEEISRKVRSVRFEHIANSAPVVILEMYPDIVDLEGVFDEDRSKIVDVTSLDPVGSYRRFAVVPRTPEGS